MIKPLDRGSAHQECNLNLSRSKKSLFCFIIWKTMILVLFHNLENYDSYLLFQEFRKYHLKLNVIPKTIEKYMSFTIKQPENRNIKRGLPLVFIDSIHF